MHTEVAPRALFGRSNARATTFALVACAIAFALLTIAPRARATFTITSWAFTPSTLQAGAHPDVTFRLNPDAVQGDKNGDDLKSVRIEFSSGMLANPEAVGTPCTATQFNADGCPSATQVGTISAQYRKGSSYFSMPGSLYVIPPDADSAMSFGFILRPTGYRKIFLRSSKVTGMVGVRTGLDADYGLTATIDSIPRTLTTTLGTLTNVTISDITVNLFSRSGSTKSGRYFTFAPTRCDAASARATMTSYLGVSIVKTASVTPTGCDAVPFQPGFSLAPLNPEAGQATGVTATLTMPTADAAIQNSHIKDVTVTLPAGTGLNMANIGAVGAVCADSALSADACPAASRIGSASVAVPFLPPTMTGDIYLTHRDSSIGFGYVLRGARGTKAVLKGSAAAVDLDGDGAADAVRATLATLPQVPYSSATLTFNSALVNNPLVGCGSHVSSAKIDGYSGASATIAQPYAVVDCVTPPDTTITDGPEGLIGTSTPSFIFSATPADGATFECSLDGAAFSSCTSAYFTPKLADGAHHFAVRAVNIAGPDPTPATRDFTVDDTPPVVTIDSPTQGQTVTSSSLDIAFSTGDATDVLCKLDSSYFDYCTSPYHVDNLADGNHTIQVAAIDTAGNLTIVRRAFTVLAATPVVTIGAPADGSSLSDTQFTAQFSATGTITGYQCELQSTTSGGYAYIGSCAPGQQFVNLQNLDNYRFTVTATRADGATGSASVTFAVNSPKPPPPNLYDGPLSATSSDRTPTFQFSADQYTSFPNTTFECAIVQGTDPPTSWNPCGSGEYGSYTSPTALANGAYWMWVRTVNMGVPSDPNSWDFNVADWSSTFGVTLSTTDAGAHPDIDVRIQPAAGQLRLNDLLMPKGMIGGLTAFPKCSAALAPTGNCPAETKIGRAAVAIQVVGIGIGTSQTKGPVYLTEPWVPGDAAGFVIRINSPMPGIVASVNIPLRVILENNSQQMRIFSDSIPVTSKYVADRGEDVNYYVSDFQMHIDGSKGSPFPLVTNPSSCAASQFSARIGDLEGNTNAVNVPFTATNCGALPFAPTFTQTYANPVAGQSTGLHATVTMPTGSSSLKSIRVVEPPSLAPNFSAFGDAADQCSTMAAPLSSSTFNPAYCPSQSRVGTMQISSPLLPTPVTGDVYLIAKNPLPWFGVSIVDPAYGINVKLLGITSTPNVDPLCDPAVDPSGFCQTQIAVLFAGAPDLPVSQIDFDLNGPSRQGINNPLPGTMVSLSQAGDATCTPTQTVAATIVPNSGGAVARRTSDQAVTGC